MVNKPKRRRDISLHVMISQSEYEQIKQRMAEAGTINMSAFARKLILNGYVLHVDLSPVKELASLQRRCSNNLNQIATNVNTHGGITSQEIASLQHDYDSLWDPLSELLKQLAEIVKM